MGFKLDLTGRVFERLTVLSYDEERSNISHLNYWICQCECGTVRTVLGRSLICGNTRSCGCLQREVSKGLSKYSITHGQAGTRLYRIWCNLKNRCFNPNVSSYLKYGGSGIVICEDWLVFDLFYKWAHENGYEEHLSLDRIDNSGNYEPLNCKWATVEEQNNNKTNHNLFSYNGKTLNESQWAKELGLTRGGFRSRVRRGLVGEQLFAKKKVSASNKKQKRNRLHNIWYGMKDRCCNPKSYNYKNYGRKGVSVCSSWLEEVNFVKWAHENGYEEHLSLDRIDNNKGYSPENCRWATNKAQNRNLGCNVFLTHDGKTLCKADWAEELGISYGGFNNRVMNGCSDDKLFHVGKLPTWQHTEK